MEIRPRQAVIPVAYGKRVLELRLTTRAECRELIAEIARTSETLPEDGDGLLTLMAYSPPPPRDVTEDAPGLPDAEIVTALGLLDMAQLRTVIRWSHKRAPLAVEGSIADARNDLSWARRVDEAATAAAVAEPMIYCGKHLADGNYCELDDGHPGAHLYTDVSGVEVTWGEDVTDSIAAGHDAELCGAERDGRRCLLKPHEGGEHDCGGWRWSDVAHSVMHQHDLSGAICGRCGQPMAGHAPDADGGYLCPEPSDPVPDPDADDGPCMMVGCGHPYEGHALDLERGDRLYCGRLHCKCRYYLSSAALAAAAAPATEASL